MSSPEPESRSPSADPLDCIDDPLTPERNQKVGATDTSPAVRKPHWGRVSRFPSEAPSEDAGGSSPVPSGLSTSRLSESPEVGDSPAVRRPWGRFLDGGLSRLEQSFARNADPQGSGDLNDMPSYAPEDENASQVETEPDTPPASELQPLDGSVQTYLDSPESSMELDEAPPAKQAFHNDGVGSVVIPFRPEPEFPQPLKDAEEKLASQIAAALTDPSDEALNSETFQTLLETFLFPRLTGCNINDQQFKLRQYSQLHAVACTFEDSSRKHKKQKHHDYQPVDKDPDTVERLKAVKERRVPDMTSVAIFEDRIPIPHKRTYQVNARKGPKICITEIKSFRWKDDPAQLAIGLRTALAKAHYQNYVAAQYLFREDKHLRHVGSFSGAGFAWSYGEFHRSQYPLLYERPLPLTPGEMEDWEESEGVATKSSRKRKRKTSKRSSTIQRANTQEENEVEEEVEEEVEMEFLKSLNHTPRMPPENTPLDEIFRRHEPRPARPNLRRKTCFLSILDLEGRTYEAFDVIVERMRRWYSEKNPDPDHQLVFDPDPYEHGTCPATVARKLSEQEENS